MSERKSAEEVRRLRGEGELTAELIVAAKESHGPLSQQQIDSILGLEPDEGTA